MIVVWRVLVAVVVVLPFPCGARAISASDASVEATEMQSLLRCSASPTEQVGSVAAVPGDTLEVYLFLDSNSNEPFLCDVEANFFSSPGLAFVSVAVPPDVVILPPPPYGGQLNAHLTLSYLQCDEYASPEHIATFRVAVREDAEAGVENFGIDIFVPDTRASFSQVCTPIRFCSDPVWYPAPTSVEVRVAEVPIGQMGWSLLKRRF